MPVDHRLLFWHLQRNVSELELFYKRDWYWLVTVIFLFMVVYFTGSVCYL